MIKKSKTYYDENKYKNANKLFDYFINHCEITTPPRTIFDNFQVSTITCVSTIGQMVNIQKFFELLNVNHNATNKPSTNCSHCVDSSDNNSFADQVIDNNSFVGQVIDNSDIIYAKYSHSLKGKKKKGKKNDTVRFKGNNQLFTNQMSIGFRCNNTQHLHKNPISVKVFRNGRIQMTGCKNMEEIHIMYDKLYNKLVQINNNYLKTSKVGNANIVQNIQPFDEKQVQIEMINGTFYVNQALDLNQVLKMFMREYSHKQVFIIQNKKSPLNLSVKMLGYFDEKKKKDKIPSVFIYNTGAINIIATKKHILIKTYHFIKNNLEKWWDQIVEKKIIYNDQILKNDPVFNH